MNTTLMRTLVVGTLAGILALALALAMGGGPADAQSSVVGPGESIQKAIDAAHPGDTIVVKGVHREDVVIRKNGIKLRGDDAVIEAPARADSPCSKATGPEAICILGDVDLEASKVIGPRVKDVSVTGFTIRGFKEGGNGNFAIDAAGARNATIVGNRATGNVTGGIIISSSNINTTVAKNHVMGNPETSTEGIVVTGHSRNTAVLKNEVRSIPFGHNAIEVNEGSVNTTIAGNHLVDNWAGPFVIDSPGTKVLSNVVSRFGIVGAFVAGQKSANTKLVGNNISGGPWGVFVTDAHDGSLVGNNVHDNCAGMFFEAFKSQPVGDFEVKGNTVADNTRSCRGQKFGRKFSGIGIVLLGASNMEVSVNHLSGNVPSGPTPISGGVVVSKDLYFRGTTFGGTQKPTNNSVTANTFGRNKPDIFWDKSGTGNGFVANLCNTSVPARLCN
jgi:parallel beta-helix repeat protein